MDFIVQRYKIATKQAIFMMIFWWNGIFCGVELCNCNEMTTFATLFDISILVAKPRWGHQAKRNIS